MIEFGTPAAHELVKRHLALRERQLQAAVAWLNDEDFDTTQSAEEVRERFNAIAGYPR